MSNIGLIVPMPFRNTCHYTYIFYLGIKINSPYPTRPRKITGRNWRPEGWLYLHLAKENSNIRFWIGRMTSNECYVC